METRNLKLENRKQSFIKKYTLSVQIIFMLQLDIIIDGKCLID